MVLKLFEESGDASKAQKIRNFFKNSNLETEFVAESCFLKSISRNNKNIIAKLTSLGELNEFSRVSPKIQELVSKIADLSFEDAVESIFEVFFEFLKQKGAMSVQYNDSKANQSVAEPNFVLQPANSISYLPQRTKSVRLTLVLDLDETLVHYKQISNETGEFYIRPFAQEFLVDLSAYFEIVIFTAAIKSYADWIIDRLDLENCISHRLYRCSTKQQKGVFIKDLSRLGRDLSKTIIVDNNPDNFQYQNDNGICIKSWYNDPNDNALKELMKVLKFVARRENEDVREVLKTIREKMQRSTTKEIL